MSLDAIKQITSTEQEASTLIENAHAKAREIVLTTQKQVHANYEELIRQQSQKTIASQNEAQLKSEKLSAQLLEQARSQCVALRSQAQKNMDSAVAIVIERVVG